MKSERCNILFLFPDQHRPDWLGINPDLSLRTPHIDQLCERGVRFTTAYCPSPLCAPSRAALAAGREYDRCGVVDNGQSYPLEQPTFYAALRDAGYRVCGVGKFDLHKPTHDWGLDGSHLLDAWGFTDGIDNEGKFDGTGSYRQAGKPCGPYLHALHRAGLADVYCAEHANIQAGGPAYTTVLPDELYCDNWLSENGLAILQSIPVGHPWFMQVNFTGPHSPMDVTPAMRERWQDTAFPPPRGNGSSDPEQHLRIRQNYAAMIENIDRQAGRFMDLVEQRGERDNTLVVYASDHGEMLGDHGRFGKCTWQTPSSGIPLTIAGPGVRHGVTSSAPVNLIDLAATFTDYGGAEDLPDSDSISLRPLVEGATERHRDAVVCGLREWRLVCDGRIKLVVGNEGGPMLFDLLDDPWETRNICGRRPELAAKLQKHLDNIRVKAQLD